MQVEPWALTKKAKEELKVWERKILNLNMYVHTYTLYGELKPSMVINPQKIRWFGHTLEKGESCMVNGIMLYIEMRGEKWLEE